MAARITTFFLGFLLNLTAFAQNSEALDRAQLDSVQQVKKADSLNFMRRADSLKAVAATIKLKAQKQDTTRRNSSGLDTLQTDLQSLKNLDQQAKDSLGLKALELRTQKYQSRLDSIKQKRKALSGKTMGGGITDSLKALEGGLKAGLPGDSVRTKLKSTQSKITTAVDPNTYVNKVEGKVEALQQKAVDTVSTRIQRKFSKVNSTQDSLGALTNKPDELVSNTQNKIEGKADQLVSGTQNKVSEKVDNVTGLPEKGLDQIPDTDLSKKADLPVNTANLSDLPEADLSKTDLSKTGLPAADLPVDALKSQDIPGVEVDGLNDLTKELDLPDSELSGVTKELN